jgi:hypothetical protein
VSLTVAVGMRHLAWANDAAGMADWPHRDGETMAEYIVRHDLPPLLLALELVTEQRDELARQLGIEPEWTEQDA